MMTRNFIFIKLYYFESKVSFLKFKIIKADLGYLALITTSINFVLKVVELTANLISPAKLA